MIVSDIVSINGQTMIDNAVVKNAHVAPVSDELGYKGLSFRNNLSQLVGSITTLQGEVTSLNEKINDLKNDKL